MKKRCGLFVGLLTLGGSLPAGAQQEFPQGFPHIFFDYLNACASFRSIEEKCAREANDLVRAAELHDLSVEAALRAQDVLETFGLDESIGSDAREQNMADYGGGSCTYVTWQEADPRCDALLQDFNELLEQSQRTSDAFYLGHWVQTGGSCDGDSAVVLDATTVDGWEQSCRITVEALGQSTAVMALRCGAPDTDEVWTERVVADRTETGMTLTYLNETPPDAEAGTSQTAWSLHYETCPVQPGAGAAQ